MFLLSLELRVCLPQGRLEFAHRQAFMHTCTHESTRVAQRMMSTGRSDVLGKHGFSETVPACTAVIPHLKSLHLLFGQASPECASPSASISQQNRVSVNLKQGDRHALHLFSCFLENKQNDNITTLYPGTAVTVLPCPGP